MQVVCYGAGLTPNDFWDCSIDEAILTYKGKVMDWRVLRNGFLLTVAPYVKQGESLVDKFPLPFDDEGKTEMSEDEMLAAYNRAKEVTETWLKGKNG